VDSDFDGQQDANETLTEQVTITATRSPNVIAQATTVNGVYTLNNLPADTSFDLQFTLPTGFTLGPKDKGNDATDNDFDVNKLFGATTAHRIFVSVADGATVDLDAGIVRGATLDVFCWADADGDGIQDAGVPESNGLTGVDVAITSTGPEAYGGTGLTTGANGHVRFDNVRPGLYHLGFTHSTLKRTLQDQGGNDAIDSDAEPIIGNTANFTLLPGLTTTNVDAGFVDPGLVIGGISGHAWLDNGDGIRQTSETSLTGVHNVELYRSTDSVVGNADDQFVDGTATNASQDYQFSKLAPGKYYVRTVVPSNHVVTLQNRGANDAIDSDFDPVTKNSALITIAAGTLISSVDVGFVPGSASIGNFIWNDTDRDGIQDVGEPGLAGATVRLFTAANVLVGSSITTTTTGSYAFTGLQPGQYYVRVTPPAGYLATKKDLGGNDLTDSDIDRQTLSTPLITTTVGSVQIQWDAGFYLGARIGDRVWIDTDADGRQDSGELGKSGVNVRLWTLGADGNAGTADDVQVAVTGTNSLGIYQFTGVDLGTYYVSFSAPTGFVFTARDIDSDAADSDAGLATGRTALFTVATLTDNLTIDAGLVPSATLNVTVKFDDNDDNVIVPGVNAPNIDVLLYDPRAGVPGSGAEVLIQKGKTNSTGLVTFPGLPQGFYYVCVLLPQGYRFSLPNRTGNETTDSDVTYLCDGYGHTGIFSLAQGQRGDITVGLVPLRGKIEGTVWNDANRNKVRDSGLFQGNAPDVVLAIDISGSTSEPYAGTPIGDANGDGLANTILDAEILAGISLIQQLNNAGYGSIARIGIVTFDGIAHRIDMNGPQTGTVAFIKVNSNTDNDGALDAIEALQAIRFGGATNYEAALKEAISIFSLMATPLGQGNLLFFSDGTPTQGGLFSDEVATLRSMKTNIRAYGVGENAPLSQLQIIDPKAKVYTDTDDFFAVMQLSNLSEFARERGTPRVRVYLDLDNDNVWDSTEPSTLTLADDPDTTLDENGTYRFENVLTGSYIVRELIPAGYSQTYPAFSGGYGWLANVAPGKTIRICDFGNAAMPILSVSPASVSYRAGSSGVILSGSATVSDADSPLLTDGFLSIRVKLNSQSTDRLFIWHQGTAAGQIGVAGSQVSYGGVVIGTFTGGTAATALKITFNNKATIAAVAALSRRIAYTSTISSPSTSARTLEWVLTDGIAGDSSTRTQSLVPVL
jgi:hypothetical protein